MTVLQSLFYITISIVANAVALRDTLPEIPSNVMATPPGNPGPCRGTMSNGKPCVIDLLGYPIDMYVSFIIFPFFREGLTFNKAHGNNAAAHHAQGRKEHAPRLLLCGYPSACPSLVAISKYQNNSLTTRSLRVLCSSLLSLYFTATEMIGRTAIAMCFGLRSLSTLAS